MQRKVDKGFATEELVRAYFLKAGFFVLRSVNVRSDGADLTDVDLWLYERSATLARRRTIIDIKDKKVPQAAERLFFVKGLSEVLHVEGAGVATTDSRPALRELARRHAVLWIDGVDIQRLKTSVELTQNGRLSEEDLSHSIAEIDRIRASKQFRDAFDYAKSAVADRFGAPSANRALECVQFFARAATDSHPGSVGAVTATRLSYLCASLVAVGFDFASAEVALRPAKERIRTLSDAIRYGQDPAGTREKLEWAGQAIRDYAPNGAVVAREVTSQFLADLNAVPAEALAEMVAKLTPSNRLFEVGRELEAVAFSKSLPSFDELTLDAKSFVASVLDFSGVPRKAFAEAQFQVGQGVAPQIFSVAESADTSGSFLKEVGGLTGTPDGKLETKILSSSKSEDVRGGREVSDRTSAKLPRLL